MHGSRGCLGCYPKPKLTPSVDGLSNGRTQSQGRSVKESSVLEDSRSGASTCEMDNSAVDSQRSNSSISTLNQGLDTLGCASSRMSNPSEFINHGLLRWNQTRQQWLGNRRSHRHPQVHEPRISWNATYENLLASNKPFPQPIPLPEMIAFLVDIWEQEGLYD